MAGTLERLTRILQDQIADFPRWWNGLSPFWKYFPGGAVLLWWAPLLVGGVFRTDHLTIGTAIVVLAYTGRAPRVLLRFLLPLFLTGIVYDGKRYFADGIRATVRVAEPYLFDLRFFGMMHEGQRLTPPEWWQHHTHPVLDFITGIYYLFFIAIFVLFSAWMVFRVSRRGTRKVPAHELQVRSKGMMWSFFWVNVMGYSTYFWYPAAPPWYVARYGLGPADLTARTFAAGALRFDELLGVTIFQSMYGKGADVFGAIPSLHCAYPMIALVYTLKFGYARTFGLIYWVGMCFSAIYLNHHWVLDALWGSAYAILGTLAVDAWMTREARLADTARAGIFDPAT